MGLLATAQQPYYDPDHENGPDDREGSVAEDGVGARDGEKCDLWDDGDGGNLARVVAQGIDRDEVFGNDDPLGLGHGHALVRGLVLEQKDQRTDSQHQQQRGRQAKQSDVK